MKVIYGRTVPSRVFDVRVLNSRIGKNRTAQDDALKGGAAQVGKLEIRAFDI